MICDNALNAIQALAKAADEKNASPQEVNKLAADAMKAMSDWGADCGNRAREENRQTTKLYFEAHITTDPIQEDKIEETRAWLKDMGFKIAPLIMLKTGEKHSADSFISCRDTDFENISLRVLAVVLFLQKAGIHVRRYKIENTLVDSRKEDKFQLLK